MQRDKLPVGRDLSAPLGARQSEQQGSIHQRTESQMAGPTEEEMPILPEERACETGTRIQAPVRNYPRRKSRKFPHGTPLPNGLQAVLPSPQGGNLADGGRRKYDCQTGQTVRGGDG